MSLSRWRSTSSTSIERSVASSRISRNRGSPWADSSTTRRLTSRPARSASSTGFLPYTSAAGWRLDFKISAGRGDQGNGKGRDRLPGPLRAETVGRLRLQPDILDTDADRLRQPLQHGFAVRVEPGHFEHHGDVDIADRKSGSAEPGGDLGQQLEAGGVLPALVGAWELLPDVTHPGGTQQRVGEGVAHRVAVAVPVQAEVPGQRHSSQDQRAPHDQAMDIVALADPDCRLPLPHALSRPRPP